MIEDDATVHGRWRVGPVAVTGASGQVGTALQRRLQSLPDEVRPLAPRDDLATAFRGADAVVHLAGTLLPRKPNTYRAANLDTVVATAAALAGSGVQRVVFLSFLTARPDSSNAYLRYKSEAEEVLRASETPAVIFRCAHIYGPPTEPGPTASAFLARAGRVRLLGDGKQQVAPLYRDDVVEAIVHAALDPSTPTGTFELSGPDTMSQVEFANALKGKPIQVRTTPVTLAKILGHISGNLTPELVDIMLGDSIPTEDTAANARMFRIDLHRLTDVWQSAQGDAHAP